jgi:hypothetical protein
MEEVQRYKNSVEVYTDCESQLPQKVTHITQAKGSRLDLSETVLNHLLPCHLVFRLLKILLFFLKDSKLKCIVNVFQMNYDSISSRG